MAVHQDVGSSVGEAQCEEVVLESIACKPALQPATDVGMHGLLAVTILCYPLVRVHC